MDGLIILDTNTNEAKMDAMNLLGDAEDRERGEVLGAISAFEQILQVMPDDLATIESLWRAYSDLGDDEKSIDYLMKLGDVIQEDNDPVTAARVLNAVRGANYQDKRIDGIYKILTEVAGEEELAAIEASRKKAAEASLSCNVNASDELGFAWYLLEGGILTQEEYSSLAQDMVEMASNTGDDTLSILHVLESQTFPRMERLLAFVSKDLATPLIDLSLFDVQKDAASVLPAKFMRARGVLVFETIGSTDALVVLMNPYHDNLREEIEKGMGRKCHFFMAYPNDFDKALDGVLSRSA